MQGAFPHAAGETHFFEFRENVESPPVAKSAFFQKPPIVLRAERARVPPTPLPVLAGVRGARENVNRADAGPEAVRCRKNVYAMAQYVQLYLCCSPRIR